MRQNLIASLILIFCVFAVAQVKAQQNENFYEQYKRMQEKREIELKPERAFSDLRTLSQQNSSQQYFSPSYIPYKSSEIKEKLKIDRVEISGYESFLNESKTGIFKLLPLLDCKDAENKSKCFQINANLRTYANAYSFREKNHKDYSKFDLAIEQDSFVVSKLSVQTILVNLGDVSLENTSFNSDAMKFLAGFIPQTSVDGINNQYAQIEKGITVGNFLYTKSLPVQENTTYALRSIAYDGASVSPGKNADVIVAFRVIRKSSDGEITIIWKELSREKGLQLKD